MASEDLKVCRRYQDPHRPGAQRAGQAIEKEFGVSAAAPVMGGCRRRCPRRREDPVRRGPGHEVGANKMSIKLVQEITGLGLKESRSWWTTLQPLKEGISKADAEEIEKKLTEAGARVELK